MKIVNNNSDFIGHSKGQWAASKTKAIISTSNNSLGCAFSYLQNNYQVPAGKSAMIVGMSIFNDTATSAEIRLLSVLDASGNMGPVTINNAGFGTGFFELTVAGLFVGNVINVGVKNNQVDLCTSLFLGSGRYPVLKVIGATSATVVLYIQEY